METIFDIATPKELVELLGEDIALPGAVESFAFERKAVKDSPDVSAGLLAQLYALRGNAELAEKQLDRIRDEQIRRDYMLLISDLTAIQ